MNPTIPLPAGTHALWVAQADWLTDHPVVIIGAFILIALVLAGRYLERAGGVEPSDMDRRFIAVLTLSWRLERVSHYSVSSPTHRLFTLRGDRLRLVERATALRCGIPCAPWAFSYPNRAVPRPPEVPDCRRLVPPNSRPPRY